MTADEETSASEDAVLSRRRVLRTTAAAGALSVVGQTSAGSAAQTGGANVYVHPNTSNEDGSARSMRDAIIRTFTQLSKNGNYSTSVTINWNHPNVDIPDLYTDYPNYLDRIGSGEFSAQGSHLLLVDQVGGIASSTGDAWSEPRMAIAGIQPNGPTYAGAVGAQEVLHNYVKPDIAYTKENAPGDEHKLGKVFGDGNVSPMAASYTAEGPGADHAGTGNCTSDTSRTGSTQYPSRCTSEAVKRSRRAHDPNDVTFLQNAPVHPHPRAGGGGDGGHHVSEGVYQLVNVNSGKALEVPGFAGHNGANAQQWDVHGGANQRWRLEDQGSGLYVLRNDYSGKALEVTGFQGHNGANVQQWDVHGGANQRWRVESQGNGEFMLRAEHSGKVLEVANFAGHDGANVRQWQAEGNRTQRWRLQRV